MRVLSGARLVAVALPFVVPALAAGADDVRVQRNADGSINITIEGHREPQPTAPGARRKGGRSYTDEEKDAASLKFSLRRHELEERLNAAAAELSQTRADIAATELQKSEAHAGTDPVGRRLDALRAKERDQLRRCRDLSTDVDKLRATVTNFYDGKLPDWWREIECRECPSNREIAEGLR